MNNNAVPYTFHALPCCKAGSFEYNKPSFEERGKLDPKGEPTIFHRFGPDEGLKSS